MSKYREIDLRKIKTVSIRSRKSKVHAAAAAKPPESGASFASFLEGLPSILAGRDLKDLVDRIAAAKKRKKPVLLLAGAHVIKVGLSPVIIRLMERGILSSVSFNGAGAIHDAELAYFGRTSEEVSETVGSGLFGMGMNPPQYTVDPVSHRSFGGGWSPQEKN